MSAGVAVTPEYYNWLHNVPPEVAEVDWLLARDLLRGKYVTDRTGTFELASYGDQDWRRALPHRARTFHKPSYHSAGYPSLLYDTYPDRYNRHHWRF